jgi:short-chain Z-isoprenyl diphosphate synthase
MSGAGVRAGRALTASLRRRLEARCAATPRHVGIILDGNRRWARAQGRDPVDAYRVGAAKLDEVLAWCVDLAIPAVTLWACSTENLGRAPDELRGLLSVIENKLNAIAGDPRVHRRRIRVRAVGKLDLLPDSTLAAIRREQATAGTATPYSRAPWPTAAGGRSPTSRHSWRPCAGRTLGTDRRRVTQEGGRSPDLPDPDLIIRTSGEVRLSGFLLWQSAYSEFYFCDVHWPEFRKIDFLRALRSYQQRDRRFGTLAQGRPVAEPRPAS